MDRVTPEEHAAVEGLLAAERERTAANAAGLAGELESIVEASAQANLDDEHDPEGATVGYERARVASLLAEARSRLAQLAEAEERLRSSAFGTCERCRRPIALERLLAHPVAVTCVACEGARGRSPLRRR
jgi:DnaK suppressor protein